MSYVVDIPELRAAMARNGYNIGKLASKMGVSRATVSAVLKGKNPTYAFICKCMDALKITQSEAMTIFFGQKLT